MATAYFKWFFELDFMDRAWYEVQSLFQNIIETTNFFQRFRFFIWIKFWCIFRLLIWTFLQLFGINYSCSRLETEKYAQRVCWRNFLYKIVWALPPKWAISLKITFTINSVIRQEDFKVSKFSPINRTGRTVFRSCNNKIKTALQMDQQSSHNLSMFAHSGNVVVKVSKICGCLVTAVTAKESNSLSRVKLDFKFIFIVITGRK